MQLASPFIRLPFRFDGERLADEVNALPDDAWRRHPTGHVGNTAASLVGRHGDHTDDSIGGRQAPTKWLASDSYLAQVIAAFGSEVGRTRLMRIEPGGEATPHFDAHVYWFGRVRIHVPILTTPDVTFVCGGARQHMAAGESWVFNTFLRHNVLNPSDAHRVHLVVDTVGSPDLWRMIEEGGEEVEVPWVPGAVARFDVEQDSPDPVVSADKMRELVERMGALLPASENAETIRRAIEHFGSSWSEAWAGGGADRASMNVALDRLRSALADVPEVRLEQNGSTAQYVAQALLINSAFGPAPPGTPLRGGPTNAGNSGPDRSASEVDRRFDRPILVVSPPLSGGQMVYDDIAASPDAYTLPPGLLPALRAEPTVDSARETAYGALRDRRGHAPVTGRVVRLAASVRAGAPSIESLDMLFPDAAFVCTLRRAESVVPVMIDAWRSQRFVTHADLEGWQRADGLEWSLPLIDDPLELVDLPIAEVCARQWASLTGRLLDDLDRFAFGRWTALDADRFPHAFNEERKLLAGFTGLRRTPDLDAPPELPAGNEVLGPGARRVVAAVDERVAKRLTDGTGTVRTRRSQKTTSSTQRRSDRLASQHTESFVELLTKAEVSVFVSTYQFGQVAVLKPTADALNTEFTKVPRAMGMAFGADDRFAVGTGDEIWTHRNQPSVAAKADPERDAAACFVLRGRHNTGEIAVHELAYGSGNDLWVVNTRFSCLATLDDSSSFVPRWTPPFVSEIVPEDRCHLNGVAMREGRPRYVSLFHETDESQGWRAHRAEGGALMDVSTAEFVARGLCMPHSPRWYGGRLWVLESGKGSLSTVDVASGTTEEVVRLPGFTRGLAFIGRYALVGLSQVRESVFDGLPLTQSGEPLSSGVWIVDIETGAIGGFVRFDGAVEEVFDVQVFHQGEAILLDHRDQLQAQSFALSSDRLTPTL